jgi:hypothetical protein
MEGVTAAFLGMEGLKGEPLLGRVIQSMDKSSRSAWWVEKVKCVQGGKNGESESVENIEFMNKNLQAGHTLC